MIQREHVTLGIAITSAVLAAVSLSWTIFRDIYRRGRLKVYATFVPEKLGGRPVELAVKVANDGNEPVVVEGIFSTTSFSKSPLHWNLQGFFPKRLEAKETFTVVIAELAVVSPLIEKVIVRDSSGTWWPVSEGQMEDLRAASRASLED